MRRFQGSDYFAFVQTIVSGHSAVTRLRCSPMGKNLKAAIGGVLRAKRDKLSISQEEVAERAGVDRTYVSILERGLKSPTVETLEKICAALGTLPERVLEEARRR